MKQALHILRKDVRFLWKEILFYLFLTGLFTMMWSLEWPGDLVELVGLYIVARVMHAESVPGDRQFWLTRPYRPMSLLGAKLLFIVAFLCAPLAIAQATVAAMQGFSVAAAIPGLVWTQVLILLMAVLPVAALATVTDNLVVFISVVLVLAVVGMLGGSSLPTLLPKLFPQMPPSVSWMGEAVFGAAIGGASAAVLVWQFANRCTWFSRMFAVAAFYIAMVVYLCFPPGFSLRAEAGLSGKAGEASQIRLRLDPHAGKDAPRALKGRAGRATVQFPLALVVDGIPRDAEVRSDDISVEFGWPRSTWKPVGRVGGAARTDEAGRTIVEGSMQMDQALFDEMRLSPVTVRGRVWLTLFGDAEERTISLVKGPVNVQDGLQCYTGEFAGATETICRSLFRWPSRLVSVRYRAGEVEFWNSLVSYSPFPAGLSLIPIETRWTEPIHADEATIVTRRPLAHFYRDFEMRGIRLVDFEKVVAPPGPGR